MSDSHRLEIFFFLDKVGSRLHYYKQNEKS